MGKHSGATSFRRNLTRGFTLLELLIVVALIGITSGFAVSSWRKVHAKMEARAAMETLLVAFHNTRSDATAKDRSSGIAISSDTTAGFMVDSTMHYPLRYIRFVDGSAGTVGMFDSQDSILQNWKTLEGRVFAYSGSSSGMSGGVASIVYTADGSANNDLRCSMGMPNFRDTFKLSLLPATGLATLEH